MASEDPRWTVRRACPDDAPRIQALYRQLVNNPAVHVSPVRLREIADDPQTFLLVCAWGDAVCATALVSLCRDAMFGTRPFAVVENVVVDTDRRGTGIGELLVRHIERLCAERDCSKLMLLSSIHRADAHRFFEKMGFRGGIKRGFVKYSREFGAMP